MVHNISQVCFCLDIVWQKIGTTDTRLVWNIISLHPSALLHTGLLVDIFGEYKYLFLMSGSVIVIGGLFLFLMNIYNYYMLEREKPAEDREQNQKNIENHDQSTSDAEMKAAMEQTEPQAKEKNGAQRDPCLENAETPN